MKIRDSDAVQEAIDNLLIDAPFTYVDYDNDGDITIDCRLTLEQLKAIVAVIESVPGTSI
jgi:hypothetical protein